jgi:hypothetical protein
MGWTVRGSNSNMTMRFFASPERPDRPRRPPSLLFSGSLVLYCEKELPEGEINHSPSSSLQMKGEERETLPYHCFVLHVKQDLFNSMNTVLRKYYISRQSINVICMTLSLISESMSLSRLEMGHINAICKILSRLLGMKVCIYRKGLYINSIYKSVSSLVVNICTFEATR